MPYPPVAFTPDISNRCILDACLRISRGAQTFARQGMYLVWDVASCYYPDPKNGEVGDPKLRRRSRHDFIARAHAYVSWKTRSAKESPGKDTIFFQVGLMGFTSSRPTSRCLRQVTASRGVYWIGATSPWPSGTDFGTLIRSSVIQ